MKDNILLFLNCSAYSGKSMSGGTQMFIQIFRSIRKKFNKFYVYTNIDGKINLEKNNLETIDFLISNKLFDRFNLIINYVFRTIEAFSCLKLKNVNIIYSTSDFFPDVIPAFFYRIFNKKTKWFQCVFHIYPDWKIRQGNKIVNFVGQYLQQFSLLFIKKADYIININSQVKRYLIGKGFDSNKIIINTPGIDFSYINNLKIHTNEIKYEATFLSRLAPSKGIFDLVEIWRKVVKIRPKLKLAIIGGGSEEIENKLKKQIKGYKLEKNIDLLGFLENDDTFSLIKNSRVFLFPSHEEGFGIAIAEAMACKIPVISWNLPIYDEVFEDNLVQIEEYDVNLYCAKIIELFENNELRNKISKKAFIFIKKYDWKKIVKKHLEILGIS